MVTRNDESVTCHTRTERLGTWLGRYDRQTNLVTIEEKVK